VPETAAGKRAKCPHCAAVFRVPQPENADDGLLHFADDAPPPERLQPAPPLAATPATPDAATDEQTPRADVWRRFFGDVIHGITFPARLSDLVTYLILTVAVGLGLGIGSLAPCIGYFVVFIVLGWFASFMLRTIEHAAAGEDGLPQFALTEGWVDDILVPFFKILTTTLLCYAPALLVTFLLEGALAFGPTDGPLAQAADLSSSVTYLLVLALSFFLWPMTLLTVSIGGFLALARIDLMFVSIARTLPAYLVTVAFVYAAIGMQQGLLALMGTFGIDLLDRFWLFLGIVAAGGFASVYSNIVAMRVIGSYYHRFQDRFAFAW
jgi:hypothetical protein